MINAIGLTKYYGVNCAVDNLTFNAEKGEVLGFLGPNGAGKTTTMRILTGYMPPTSGTVTIGGFDVIEQSIEVRKLVGYLPESVPLYPDMRVYDYLKFMGQLRNLDKIDDRVESVLEQVGMTERAESFIAKLSKGMRQRIGLAQALVHQPEVLILDEPTIGLDPAQIIEVRKLIQEIGKEKTVLLSTHILSEAQQICDRVMIINRGKLVAEDSPEHLQKRLAGSRKVSVNVMDNVESALTIITAFPELGSAHITDRGQIEFENPANQDMRPMVTKALVAANLDLLEMHTESASLEDIFLQLIHEEGNSENDQSTGKISVLDHLETQESIEED
jgi:ABC-2 type transport system ATP-binding protein